MGRLCDPPPKEAPPLAPALPGQAAQDLPLRMRAGQQSLTHLAYCLASIYALLRRRSA